MRALMVIKALKVTTGLLRHKTKNICTALCFSTDYGLGRRCISALTSYHQLDSCQTRMEIVHNRKHAHEGLFHEQHIEVGQMADGL